jgi:hypothetical protein
MTILILKAIIFVILLSLSLFSQYCAEKVKKYLDEKFKD